MHRWYNTEIWNYSTSPFSRFFFLYKTIVRIYKTQMLPTIISHDGSSVQANINIINVKYRSIKHDNRINVLYFLQRAHKPEQIAFLYDRSLTMTTGYGV